MPKGNKNNPQGRGARTNQELTTNQPRTNQELTNKEKEKGIIDKDNREIDNNATQVRTTAKRFSPIA